MHDTQSTGRKSPKNLRITSPIINAAMSTPSLGSLPRLIVHPYFVGNYKLKLSHYRLCGGMGQRIPHFVRNDKPEWGGDFAAAGRRTGVSAPHEIAQHEIALTCSFTLVILRPAFFAGRRIDGLVGSTGGDGRLHRSFGAKGRRLRMTRG